MTIKSAVKPDATDMSFINKYARRELTADEVYTFPVTLCDNEIDRDKEMFPLESLEALAKLFVGKTGIFDHNNKTENQSSRIYKTGVELTGDVNSIGEPYARLTACAYIVRTDKTAELIAEIDAGIKKEVSIGCSIGEVICSECGANIKEKPCVHRKGVDGVYHILKAPTDAYEWSFVAVPAQRAAGVTKKFETESEGGEKMIFNKETDAKIKALCDEGKEITLKVVDGNPVVGEAIVPEVTKAFLTVEQAETIIGKDVTLDTFEIVMKAAMATGMKFDELAEALEKYAAIQTKASQYDTLLAEEKALALKNGFTAKGDKFNTEIWSKALDNMGYDEIKAFSKEWAEEAGTFYEGMETQKSIIPEKARVENVDADTYNF